ncbi:primosomal protein N' [Desertibacillus haloalkaliphilus]|uniref:primosomal protein N' n=1 Tax=Desertibacillus haloalkaliphilus TaxID=1328930 RepID=UPI001C27348A|nr:primosomal protein N' [Desertibacillus haloalkaliphilus]MBU8907064.1 primosomal protein N' [Desertibacillus haloalkaliphilus]
MIARVIVDVPTGQTDRLFDYLIPNQWQGVINVGMRVVVPFGPRHIQGFVIDITSSSEVKKLKSIVDVLDLTPVLTEELLELGEWLTETTLCFKISAYQVMLPAAMRSKVKKEIRILSDGDKLPASVATWFQKRSSVRWEEIVQSDPGLLKDFQHELKKGRLDVFYHVKDQVSKKTHKVVRPNGEGDDIEAAIARFDARADKQKLVMEHFLDQRQEIPVHDLVEKLKVSRTTIKALVQKGMLIESEVEVYRDPYKERTFQPTKPLPLTNEQQQVIAPILDSVENQSHKTFLLHGVTGSGKTEIYLQSIQRVLEKGKEAIVLVPEISLTPQMVNRFKSRFGSQVAVLHSALSKGEKYDEWRKIHRGEVRVVVGARSAIFAPFENLGIIIIDEEHESSYKQEENPRYHARDVAIYRGHYYSCPVVLGSATPSLETYARAQKGVYHLLPLLTRVNDIKMPSVDIIDMREELREGNRSMFSRALYDRLNDRLEKGEQSVLFLNRRGYSTFVMCRDCGYVATCPHCDISLTFHRSQHAMKCHYCGHQERMPSTCQSCESEHIRFFGSGTQKVEEELAKVLPGARVIRMDVDTTRRKGSHERLLTAFGEGKADILLGTQMIAKGLDFPNITLVGVLAADSMLHIPDFRSAERTFQLLTQVSGRAGRHEKEGEVIIQSYTPEHYSIQQVREHNYLDYFQEEMNVRKQSGYPPYYFLTVVTVSHSELANVVSVTEKITRFLHEQLQSNHTVILGPVASPIPRIKDRYRYQCMIKYKNEPSLVKVLREVQQHYVRETTKGDLHLSIDMNPYMMM